MAKACQHLFYLLLFQGRAYVQGSFLTVKGHLMTQIGGVLSPEAIPKFVSAKRSTKSRENEKIRFRSLNSLNCILCALTGLVFHLRTLATAFFGTYVPVSLSRCKTLSEVIVSLRVLPGTTKLGV